jgi:hypothetical protein
MKNFEVSKNFGPNQQHANRSNDDQDTLDYIISKFPFIKTFVDVGCGLGKQVLIAKELGLCPLGIDGDPTIDITEIKEYFILHDFTKGPLLIHKQDLGWSIEFVEHVEERFLENYFKVFCQCRHVLMTYAPPGQKGRHHVNCQPEDYWIEKFRSHGLFLHDEITKNVRSLSKQKWIKYKGLFFVNREF